MGAVLEGGLLPSGQRKLPSAFSSASPCGIGMWARNPMVSSPHITEMMFFSLTSAECPWPNTSATTSPACETSLGSEALQRTKQCRVANSSSDSTGSASGVGVFLGKKSRIPIAHSNGKRLIV